MADLEGLDIKSLVGVDLTGADCSDELEECFGSLKMLFQSHTSAVEVLDAFDKAYGEEFRAGLSASDRCLFDYVHIRLAVAAGKVVEPAVIEGVAEGLSNSDALLSYGEFLVEHGAFAKADAVFERAYNVGCCMWRLFLGRGMLCRARGDLGSAMRYFDKSRRSGGGYRALVEGATILLMMQNFELCGKWLDEIEKINRGSLIGIDLRVNWFIATNDINGGRAYIEELKRTFGESNLELSSYEIVLDMMDHNVDGLIELWKSETFPKAVRPMLGCCLAGLLLDKAESGDGSVIYIPEGVDADELKTAVQVLVEDGEAVSAPMFSMILTENYLNYLGWGAEEVYHFIKLVGSSAGMGYQPVYWPTVVGVAAGYIVSVEDVNSDLAREFKQLIREGHRYFREGYMQDGGVVSCIGYVECELALGYGLERLDRVLLTLKSSLPQLDSFCDLVHCVADGDDSRTAELEGAVKTSFEGIGATYQVDGLAAVLKSFKACGDKLKSGGDVS